MDQLAVWCELSGLYRTHAKRVRYDEMRQHPAVRAGGLSASDETASLDVLMLHTLRHILLVLVAIALVGGTAAESARAASHGPMMLMNGIPCDMQMPVSDLDHSKPMAPCKGMTHDCINMAGCVTTSALPAQFVTQEFPIFQRVRAVWADVFDRTSLYRQPELLPPRAA